MNQIDLDWDKITTDELIDRLSIIIKYNFVYSVDVRSSPFDGYHVYIKTYNHIPQYVYFRLRREWKDDGNRLIQDVFFRRDENYSNIMFTSKIFGGTVWKEEKLFTLKRLMKGFLKFNLGYHTMSSQLLKSLIQMLHVTCAGEREQLQSKEILELWISKLAHTVEVQEE